ncbi:MAG: cytochrome c1 [Candidatus Competibacterales bacterium]
MSRWPIYFLALSLVALPLVGQGAGGDFHLDEAPINLDNNASLQRGAKLFVNYCQGCHSAEYQRYSRLADDLNLTADQVQDNLIFTTETNAQGQLEKSKLGTHMVNAMTEEDGIQWFGNSPPDLTLIARSKGVDYLYTYLRTFYLDEDRPLGADNAVYPGVSMPHVLWELQGWQKPIYHQDPEHPEEKTIEGFEIIQAGSMTGPEFDAAMADLVGFLAYIAEPARAERESIGVWVLAFLAFAAVVFYFLKREFWRDIH